MIKSKKKNYTEILKRRGQMIHKKEFDYIEGVIRSYYLYNNKEMFDKHRPVLEKKGYTYISHRSIGNEGALRAVYTIEIRG